jgi:hypothetical protein
LRSLRLIWIVAAGPFSKFSCKLEKCIVNCRKMLKIQNQFC